MEPTRISSAIPSAAMTSSPMATASSSVIRMFSSACAGSPGVASPCITQFSLWVTTLRNRLILQSVPVQYTYLLLPSGRRSIPSVRGNGIVSAVRGTNVSSAGVSASSCCKRAISSSCPSYGAHICSPVSGSISTNMPFIVFCRSVSTSA